MDIPVAYSKNMTRMSGVDWHQRYICNPREAGYLGFTPLLLRRGGVQAGQECEKITGMLQHLTLIFPDTSYHIPSCCLSYSPPRLTILIMLRVCSVTSCTHPAERASGSCLLCSKHFCGSHLSDGTHTCATAVCWIM